MGKQFLTSLVFTLCFSFRSLGQNCDCKDDLSALHNFIKENYPGYIDKTKKNNSYANLLDSLIKNTTIKTTDLDCFYKLKNLVQYFKDPHLSVSINNQSSNVERIISMFSTKKQPQFSRINSLIKKTDKISGIWEIKGQGSYYKILIESLDNSTLVGKIINADSIFWFPGQVKCVIKKINNDYYRIQLYTRDHTPVEFVIKYESGDILDLSAYGIWQRFTDDEEKLRKIDSETLKSKSIGIKEFRNTFYLRIPSFDISNYNTLLQALSESIPMDMSKKNLIIDLRGNSGGSTVVSSLLLKYVYKTPIQLEGSSFKASKLNTEDFEKIVSRPSFNSVNKDFWNTKVNLFKTSQDSLVAYTDKRQIKLDSISAGPKKVYILVNNFSSSTTEYFLLQAIQNKEVIVVGQQTRGAIDYTDIGLPHTLPSQLFYAQTPMVRSNRLSFIKLDNVGIKPNIVLSETTDALDFVKKLIND